MMLSGVPRILRGVNSGVWGQKLVQTRLRRKGLFKEKSFEFRLSHEAINITCHYIIIQS